VKGAIKRGRKTGRDVVKLMVDVSELPDVADPTTSGARFAFGEHWVADVPVASWRATRHGWRTKGRVPGLRKATIRRRRRGGAVVRIRSTRLDLSAVEQADQLAEVHVDVGPWSATHARRWETFRRGLRPPR
jgi:hypothetical protein